MAVTWVTFFGGAVYFEPFDALDETIQGATTSSFYLQTGTHLMSFYGQFTLDAGGNITGGTIAGFKGYVGGIQVLNAYGYAMNFGAFNALRSVANQDAFVNLIMPDGLTINGTAQSDYLFGGTFNDILIGLGEADFMIGRSGNDFMTGGDGKDEINGGDGNDTASYSEKTSPIEVTLQASTKVFVKVGGVDEDTIVNVENVIGGSANDTMTGDGLSNGLFGFGGDDKLAGKDGNDTLAGNDGRDRLDGGKGNDQLTGGLGKDLLKGGKDSDTFVFIDILDKHSNVDKLRDFKPGVDKISLYHGVFAGLDIGDLKAKHFHEGHKAADGDDHIIYDDGKLSFDADGKGGAKQIAFAVLKGAPDISAHDFVVI